MRHSNAAAGSVNDAKPDRRSESAANPARMRHGFFRRSFQNCSRGPLSPCNPAALGVWALAYARDPEKSCEKASSTHALTRHRLPCNASSADVQLWTRGPHGVDYGHDDRKRRKPGHRSATASDAASGQTKARAEHPGVSSLLPWRGENPDFRRHLFRAKAQQLPQMRRLPVQR